MWLPPTPVFRAPSHACPQEEGGTATRLPTVMSQKPHGHGPHTAHRGRSRSRNGSRERDFQLPQPRRSLLSAPLVLGVKVNFSRPGHKAQGWSVDS